MFFIQKPLFFALVALLFHFTPVWAGDVYEVGRGDPARKAILNTIRPAIEARLRGPVEFVVHQMRIQNDWGFVAVDPQRPGGGAIDPSKTSFASDIDMMDGFSTQALVRFANGRWNLIDFDIGSTDAAFIAWHQMYGAPRAVLGY